MKISILSSNSVMEARDHFKNGANLKSQTSRGNILRRFFLLAAVAVFATVCVAQDIIVTKDSKRIDAKVTEINEDNIKYKRFDNLNGPVYTLSKSNIASIIYKNGTVEAFTVENVKPATPPVTVVEKTHGSNPVDIQSDHRNLLRELTKRGKKICIITEAVDPAENSMQTIKYIEDNLLPKFTTSIANLSYWKIVKDVKDADFVMVYTCYKIFGYNSYGARFKFFDNQMNFLHAPIFPKGIAIKKLPSYLQSARISKTSPFYNDSRNVKHLRAADERRFDDDYNSLLEFVEYRQNRKILEYADRCIRIKPELPVLYQIKAAALIDMNAKSMSTVYKLCELDPLNSNIEFFFQYAGYEKYNRQARNAAVWSLVGASLSAAANTYNSIQLASTTSNPTYSMPSNTALIQTNNSSSNTAKGSTLQRETCSFCKGTGVSPISKSVTDYGTGTKTWCDVCKSWGSPHYHPSCPSCNGKGYNLRSSR